MDPFVQMVRAAQGGEGLDNVARLYGLSVQQAQAAAEAMMPAFAMGLRRTMGTPEGLAQLMALMMRGPYGSLYDRGAQTLADLNKPGSNALSTVFGSEEVSRAVLDHASASTGLGVAVVKQMMPTFATLVIGGLTKSLAASGALNQMLAGLIARASGQPEPTGNPWVDGLASMMTAPQRPRSTGNPWVDAFAEMMIRSPFEVAGRERAQNPAVLWQEMISSTLAAMGGAPRAEPAKPAAPPPPALGQWPFQDYFAQLFTTGFPPPAREGAPAPYDPFGLLPMADFWSQMLDRSSGQVRRPRDPKS